MLNFEYRNPVKILFGKGQISKIGKEIPADARILMTYGGGSIKRNGVYDQVRSALAGRSFAEFGGIEPNPRYETLMKAVEIVRAEKIDFLLAVGGGSVLDGTKFIAAAAPFQGDPWDIVLKKAPVTSAVPLGTVLTLPATGSEMNNCAVISHAARQEKLPFASDLVYPQFSVLDPETTFSLPPRQISNGIVDAFVHVMEQYLTFPADAPLQDRLAEAILLTLIEEGPKTLAEPRNYEARANFMWCATMALNGLIGQGVPQDWATHMIGHEITALCGLDHGQTLAIVLPALLEVQRERKKAKLLQYAERVWGITSGTEEERMAEAIRRTREFFERVGVPTRLSAYGVAPAAVCSIPERLERRGWVALGESGEVTPAVVNRVLAVAA
ncbi:MAG TPA: iron-containing alcohol dehydrogenase [Bryobacteraceae bacterium]|nr:iron-containing alcohol dehydrogenase [Bryobacteraceae bacterium]HPU73013.1 iron-containing alcohol dehydrogenase [Bryobacteraceae bacterium]